MEGEAESKSSTSGGRSRRVASLETGDADQKDLDRGPRDSGRLARHVRSIGVGGKLPADLDLLNIVDVATQRAARVFQIILHVALSHARCSYELSLGAPFDDAARDTARSRALPEQDGDVPLTGSRRVVPSKKLS